MRVDFSSPASVRAALASKDAEIERLRAEVRTLRNAIANEQTARETDR